MTDSDEEDCVETMRVAGITPNDSSVLDVLMKEGQTLYLAQRFGEAKATFGRALQVACESSPNSSSIVQAANNVSACCLCQQDFQGVLKYVSTARKASVARAMGRGVLAKYRT